MVIKSSYTELQLNFDVVETLDPLSNQPMLLIKHDSLRDVLYNQLNITQSGSINYNYVKADKDHGVVECTIDDGKGRVVKEIGEAVPETLRGDIAQVYPTLIASQRAFDRAAILLLKLAGKQLSSSEMSEFISVDLEPAILKSDVMEDQQVLDDGNDVEPYASAPISTDNDMMIIPDGIDNVISEDETPVEEAPVTPSEEVPVEENQTVIEDLSDKIKQLGDMVFNAGKYTGKPDTIAQIYANDKEYFTKLLKIAHPAESLADALSHVREYVELLNK